MKKILILNLLLLFNFIAISQAPFSDGYYRSLELKRKCTETLSLNSHIALKVYRDTTYKLKEYKRYHRKFLLKSAIIPGWGQASNKQYWKIPIIYAAIGGGLYSMIFANKRYKEFKQAYAYRTDNDSITVDKYDPILKNGHPKYTEDQMKKARDFYRRNRDLSAIIIAAIYGLNIIDAYVASYLKEFDVSDKLSLKINNINIRSIRGKYYLNAGVELKLKGIKIDYMPKSANY